MNTKPDFDRIAGAWLAEGPTELADRVLDAALREVHQTKQRRGLLAPWRSIDMTPATRLAAAAVLAVVALGGAAYLIGRPPSGPAAVPTATPSPASTLAACGHELAQGLYLTAGCAYDVSLVKATLSIVSDGTWEVTYQAPSAFDFVAILGKAQNTTVRLRSLGAVLANPCQAGSDVRTAGAPATSQAYLDWLGAFVPEAARAVRVDALGLHGWRFDIGAAGQPTADPAGCELLSLSEPAVPLVGGLAPETVAIDRNERVQVYVLDAADGVLLAFLYPIDAPGAEAAGQAFLAGITVKP